MARLILGIGGNQGDREKNLLLAGDFIRDRLGRITAVSPIIESEAWGYKSDNYFLNRVLIVETGHTPGECLGICHEIEEAMGRQRSSYYTDRSMDIDILFYDNIIYPDEKLLIPHPRLHKRTFVLKPLEKILPDLIHPLLGISVRELLALCEDETKTTWYKTDHSTVLLP